MNSTGNKTIPKRQLSRETEQRLRNLQRPQATVAGQSVRRNRASASGTTSSAAPKRTPTFSGHEKTSEMEAVVTPVSRPTRKVLSVGEVPPPPLPGLTPANVTGTTPWQTSQTSALPPRPPTQPFTNNKLASAAASEVNDATKVSSRPWLALSVFLPLRVLLLTIAVRVFLQ